MKILIVEDDEHKSSQISLVIQEHKFMNLSHALVDNAWSAVRFLQESIPTALILDMSLPSHKAKAGQGAPVSLPTGGIEILFELKKKGLTHLPILILTQYTNIAIEGESIPIDEAGVEFYQQYGFKNIVACHYDTAISNEWKIAISSFLRNINENTFN